MKSMRFAVIPFCFVLIPVLAEVLVSGQDAPFKLKADLAIGVEDGDENLIFGSVSQIDLDRDGRIYMLDSKDKMVRIFESDGKFSAAIPIPAGQGPAELTRINAMAVSPDGLIFLNEDRKVVVFDRHGKFIRNFPLDFNARTIGNAGDETVIVLGLQEDKILHVYSPEGNLIQSFGEPFEIPASLSEFKDMPYLKAPVFFSTSKTGRVYVLNPHRYEISIFEKGRLTGVLKGKSDIFEKADSPTQARGRAFLFPAAFIQSAGERTYVTIRKPMAKTGHEMDVFEGGRQIGCLTVSGLPWAIDQQGRLYFEEEEDYPRIVRYIVEK